MSALVMVRIGIAADFDLIDADTVVADTKTSLHLQRARLATGVARRLDNLNTKLFGIPTLGKCCALH